MKSKPIIFMLLSSFLFTTASLNASELQRFEKKYQIKTDETLAVYLEVDAGSLTIGKNDHASEIHVTGEINEKDDKLEIGYDKKYDEFSLTLDRKGWFKSTKDRESSRLDVELPANVEIMLEIKVKAGESHFELGGMMLKKIMLRNFAGELRIDFGEPNKVEMNLLDINLKIGESRLRHLANARFHTAKINSGIGELHMDFLGEALESSTAEIDLDIGETIVELPGDLGIKLSSTKFGFLSDSKLDDQFERKGRYYYSKNYDSAKKTMYVKISTGIGGLVVHFR